MSQSKSQVTVSADSGKLSHRDSHRDSGDQWIVKKNSEQAENRRYGGKMTEKTRKPTFKEQVYEMISGGLTGSPWARMFSGLIIVLILLSVVSMILESYETIHNRFNTVLFWLEAATVAVFTLEYILGLWTADLAYPDSPHPRLKFMCSFMAIIELLAVLPFYLSLILKDPAFLNITEIFQLLRLLHVLKLGEYNKALHTVGKVIREVLPQLLIILFIALFGMLTAAIILYKIENPRQPEQFPNIIATLWWAIRAALQIGTETAVPLTGVGRLCVTAVQLLCIGLVAVPVGIIASSLNHQAITRRQEQKQEEQKRFCPWCGHKID